MSTPSAEKTKGFEAQIENQLQAMDLSTDVLDAQLEMGKVSEIVGENAGENIPTGKKAKSTGLKIISQQVAGLLSGGNTQAHSKALPKPAMQRKKVKKEIEKRTRKLVAKATKMQNSKNFSAAHLEEILLEIRHLREILAELFHVTVERMEDLYRRYVLGVK